MSTTVTVTAIFQARPGKEAELRSTLLGLLPHTRREKGCLNYDLHVLPDDPAKFLFHENWTDRACLEAHMNSAHVKAFVPRIEELCVSFPDLKFWERIG